MQELGMTIIRHRAFGIRPMTTWFYELPARVTFDFVVVIDTNSLNPGAELISLEIEVGILTDSVPDTTTTNG